MYKPVIRAAVPGDLAAITELYFKMYDELAKYDFPFRLDRDNLTQVLTAQINSKLNCVAVAELDGVCLGFVSASLLKMDRKFRDDFGSLIGRINDVYVSLDARRLGCAGRLVDFAENWLNKSGAKLCELNVLCANSAALAFWNSRGFCSLTRLMYKELSDV